MISLYIYSENDLISMQLNLIDIINSITAFLLIIFIIFLVHKGRRKRSNLILALFFFSELIGYIDYFIMFHPEIFKIQSNYLFSALKSSGFLWGPLLFLYIKSLTGKIDLKSFILHFFPFIVSLPGIITISLIVSERTVNYRIIYFIFLLGSLQVFIYNIFSLLLLHRYQKKMRQDVNSQEFVWLKIILAGYIIACFTSQLLLIGISLIHIIHPFWNFITYIIFFIFFSILFYKAMISPYIFIMPENKLKYLSSKLTSDLAQVYLEKITGYMEQEKPYLDTNLTIGILSQELGISEKNISQVINQFRNQHFYDFINSYRVEEAKRLLSGALKSSDTIMGIAFDSGFNSKTTFNVAFKKFTGTSPTGYREQVLKKDH